MFKRATFIRLAFVRITFIKNRNPENIRLPRPYESKGRRPYATLLLQSALPSQMECNSQMVVQAVVLVLDRVDAVGAEPVGLLVVHAQHSGKRGQPVRVERWRASGWRATAPESWLATTATRA